MLQKALTLRNTLRKNAIFSFKFQPKFMTATTFDEDKSDSVASVNTINALQTPQLSLPLNIYVDSSLRNHLKMANHMRKAKIHMPKVCHVLH